jgi:hypothetical protein
MQNKRIHTRDMDKQSATSSASIQAPSLPAKRSTSSVSERLTNSEFEALLCDKKESAAYFQKVFRQTKA